jgi:hypothetical protein
MQQTDLWLFSHALPGALGPHHSRSPVRLPLDLQLPSGLKTISSEDGNGVRHKLRRHTRAVMLVDQTVRYTSTRRNNRNPRRRRPPPRRRRRPQRRRRGPPRQRYQMPAFNGPQSGYSFMPSVAGATSVPAAPPHRANFIDKVAGFAKSAAPYVGGALKILSGMGDYNETKIGTNSLVRPLHDQAIPFMHSSNESIRVTRREFLGVIGMVPNPADTFAQFYRVLNPGDAATFPWLHNMARNYTQWVPCGIVFEYNATCGTGIATTPNIGTIRMATQYDVYEPKFGSDFVRLNNHFFSSTGAPYISHSHAIECAPDHVSIKPLFIRPEHTLQHTDIATTVGALTLTTHADPSYDARLYDLGRFEMLNSGSVAAYNAGELWITYDIILMKPRVQLTNGFTYVTDYTVPDQTATLTQIPEYNMAVYDVDLDVAEAEEEKV